MRTNHLKYKIYTCILVTLLLCLLSGCGSVDPQDYVPQNKEAYNDFNDLYSVWKNLYEKDLPIIDWDYPEYNVGLPYGYCPRKNYDKPVIRMYILPVATDELLDKYVDTVLIMDQYFASNEEYQRFCKKCQKPFYLAFVDRDSEMIGQVVLDGTNTASNVKQIISDGVQASKPKLAASLEEFEKILERSSIPRDENGKYYFILDTKHYTDSVNEIIQCIDQVSPYNPISFEESRHYPTAAPVMGYPDRSFTIYVDEYGKEDLGEIEFAEGYEYCLSRCYNYINPYTYGGIGTVNDVDLYFSASYKNNPKDDRLTLSANSDVALTEDEIANTLFDFYEKLYQLHEEHGIVAWKDLRITGTCMSAHTEGYQLTIDYSLPMDRFYEKDEFAKLFFEGTREEDPAIYILPDDCF